jgi:hypothetical protein
LDGDTSCTSGEGGVSCTDDDVDDGRGRRGDVTARRFVGDTRDVMGGSSSAIAMSQSI